MAEKIQKKIVKKHSLLEKSKGSEASPIEQRSTMIAQIKAEKQRRAKDSLNSSISSSSSLNRLGLLCNYREVSKALENAYHKVIANPIQDPEQDEDTEHTRNLKTQYIRSLSSLEMAARSKSPK